MVTKLRPDLQAVANLILPKEKVLDLGCGDGSLLSHLQIENYLRHRGDSFVQRFDANSWLYLSKALDYFNLAEGKRLSDVFANSILSFLVISFTSDWLYPAYHAKELVSALTAADCDVTYINIESTWGHDAFLLEVETMTKILSQFLNRVSNSKN